MKQFEYRQVRMGVEARMVVYANEETHALHACRAAYHRLSELEAKMSDYRPDSELMLLCQQAVGRWVRVSCELFYVLWRAQKLASQTDGAFDITVGPLVQLWREARRTGRLPDEATLQEARARTGWRKLELSLRRRAARLAIPQMRLDLGGIAKGYACDEALRTLKRFGIRRALVQMGGDLAVGDPPPDQKGWRIEIPFPDGSAQTSPRLEILQRCALSVSGSTEQYVEIEGKRYAHIIDPRTGLGLTRLTLAIVKAPDGITADSLATTACMLGPEGVDRLKRLYPRASIEVIV
ncbi:MAG: FAD:protein FMN transferase [Fimbriimonadales bacterium]|nr:FAD:protein FMN transferase [Fimbriimonadales bacterium]